MNPLEPGGGGPRNPFSFDPDSDEGDDASPKSGVVGTLPVAYISH